MNFVFSFSGSIQEEGYQDPPKMEVLNEHNGLSKANNCEPSKEETRGGSLFNYFSPLDVPASSSSSSLVVFFFLLPRCYFSLLGLTIDFLSGIFP